MDLCISCIHFVLMSQLLVPINYHFLTTQLSSNWLWPLMHTFFISNRRPLINYTCILQQPLTTFKRFRHGFTNIQHKKFLSFLFYLEQFSLYFSLNYSSYWRSYLSNMSYNRLIFILMYGHTCNCTKILSKMKRYISIDMSHTFVSTKNPNALNILRFRNFELIQGWALKEC